MEVKTEEEARKIIVDMLGKHLFSLSISTFGRRLYARIVYTDYKPERVVRNEIEAAIPNLLIEVINRECSQQNIVDALYEDKTVLYVESVNGRLDKTFPGAFINELVMEMDFSGK